MKAHPLLLVGRCCQSSRMFKVNMVEAQNQLLKTWAFKAAPAPTMGFAKEAGVGA